MNTSNFVSIPAQMFPDQEILVSGSVRLTYGKLWERIRRTANALRELGVGRGDTVAVLQTNSHQYVEAYFATAALGGVFLPLNYRAKPPELRYMIEAARTAVLLVGARYLPVVRSLREQISGVRKIVCLESPEGEFPGLEDMVAAASPEFTEVDVEDEETTVLMYTSGTTAMPKAVLLTYGDFTVYVCNNVELADGTPRGTALLCVPLYHIAGMTNVMTTLFTGRRLVLLPQFEPKSWLDAVTRFRVTHAFVVPTMLKQILGHPEFDRADLRSLEVLSYGGAPMPLPVIREAIERFPKTVGFVNAFGQTETTSTLTLLGPEDHRLEGTPEEIERKLRRLSSIGRPLPDVEVRIVDEEGKEVPPGTVGELWVRTPRVMKGYAGADSPLREGGWLPTRDMAWVDDEGYLYLAGRKDDIIIRGGENIAPAEVEAVLGSHPAVDEAAVVGVPDVEWGQKVVAFVVPKPGARVTPEELQEFCRARLASFKKPELVFLVPELPKSPLGKLLRRELRALAERNAAGR
ncbi:MAG: AMP-dependent ligase [Candidatus Binatia bacterium]|nr:MAG: AMP-dependent ligase [Candidatus Binatia bacterium]